jgi:hypothetical protein
MPPCAFTTPLASTVAGAFGFSVDPRTEEAHWSRFYLREPYCRSDRDFEDYAPAYCVGYVGCAQYGGSYDDAETSLCANWVRIKGDSRLSLDEARCAIRAAWDRVAFRAAEASSHRVDPAVESESFRDSSAMRQTGAPAPAAQLREMASP